MKGTITESKTYRYFTHGNPEIAEHMIFVLHGYGQLAEYFLKKFQDLPDKNFIIAPEGMHRFYLTGSSGRVGASWMTKEEREADILDTINWLDVLDKEISKKYNFTKKHLLGFSQGGATAARWQYTGNIKADKLIIWASVFPPDLLIENEIIRNAESENHFLIGDQDEYYSSEQQNDLIQFYNSKGFVTHHYEGKHDINSSILSDVLT